MRALYLPEPFTTSGAGMSPGLARSFQQKLIEKLPCMGGFFTRAQLLFSLHTAPKSSERGFGPRPSLFQRLTRFRVFSVETSRLATLSTTRAESSPCWLDRVVDLSPGVDKAEILEDSPRVGRVRMPPLRARALMRCLREMGESYRERFDRLIFGIDEQRNALLKSLQIQGIAADKIVSLHALPWSTHFLKPWLYHFSADSL
jgi:hypothetical protein